MDFLQWENQPQSNAMASGAMLLIAGGMDLALGVDWVSQPDVLMTDHMAYCWFIGYIAGAFVAAPLIPYLQKRFFNIFSGILVLASGIIYVSAPYEYQAILTARYINGFGIGFTIVAFIVHGSEVAVPLYRGAVLSLEQYAISFGIAIQLIYSSQYKSDTNFASNRLHGILLIIFALLGLGTTILIIESPIFYLRQSNNEKALECRRLLRRPPMTTNDTRASLESLKIYVIQETNQSFKENIRKSLHALWKIILYRCMVALTLFNVTIYGIVIASNLGLGNSSTWTLIVFAGLRAIGTFLALLLIDYSGRKVFSLVSLLCTGGLTMAVGFIYWNYANLYDSHRMSTACTLILIAQFFAGLYIPSTSIYLGEAFPLSLKPYFVAFCVSIEQVIQIITLVTIRPGAYHIGAYFIAVGVTMCAAIIFFCFVIPETRATSLNEAQKRFQNVFYLKMF